MIYKCNFHYSYGNTHGYAEYIVLDGLSVTIEEKNFLHRKYKGGFSLNTPNFIYVFGKNQSAFLDWDLFSHETKMIVIL